MGQNFKFFCGLDKDLITRYLNYFNFSFLSLSFNLFSGLGWLVAVDLVHGLGLSDDGAGRVGLCWVSENGLTSISACMSAVGPLFLKRKKSTTIKMNAFASVAASRI